MKAISGRSSATVDWLPRPGFTPDGFPAPFSTVRFRQFAGEVTRRLPLAMGLTNRAGKFLVANEAFVITIGNDAIVGCAIEAIVVPAYQSALRSTYDRVIASCEPAEIRVALPNRPEEMQMILIQPLPTGAGFAAVISMRDIREQLRVEAQVAAATRMQAVGQLAGGVAHDFNNILTAVLILTDQLLARHPVGDDDHDALDEIRRNGLRAAALVEQLLAFARQQPQRQQLLDVAAVIDGLRSLVAQLSGPAIMVTIEGVPLRSAVLADPGQFEQVIVNLAVNARDAMAGNGLLTIRFADIAAADIAAQGHRIIPAVDHVRIDVIDTGTGIPPEIAGKIFEPFFTTKPMGQGTGLGLSTVYGIVKQSSGYVFAVPAPQGSGTMFSLYLPAAGPALAPITAAPPPPAVAADHGRLGGLRVLLVEDDNAVRITFDRALKRLGLLVVAEGSADPALVLLASEQAFDILVSDVMMPGVDGVELARQARVMRPMLPIVLMSGYAELPLHRAADAQGVRFLPKPFSLVELMDAIAEVIPEPR